MTWRVRKNETERRGGSRQYEKKSQERKKNDMKNKTRSEREGR